MAVSILSCQLHTVPTMSKKTTQNCTKRLWASAGFLRKNFSFVEVVGNVSQNPTTSEINEGGSFKGIFHDELKIIQTRIRIIYL